MIRGILDTGECCYTKISKTLETLKPDFALLNTAEKSTIGTIEAGRMTIIGERMNPTGTRIESPGMDVVSQMVCTVKTRHVQTQFLRASSPPMGFLFQPDRTENPAGFMPPPESNVTIKIVSRRTTESQGLNPNKQHRQEKTPL